MSKAKFQLYYDALTPWYTAGKKMDKLLKTEEKLSDKSYWPIFTKYGKTLDVSSSKLTQDQKCYIVKDGVARYETKKSAEHWFGQSMLDHEIRDFFFSEACPAAKKLLKLQQPYPDTEAFIYRVVYLLLKLKVTTHKDFDTIMAQIYEAWTDEGIETLESEGEFSIANGIFMVASSTGMFCKQCQSLVPRLHSTSHKTLCTRKLSNLSYRPDDYGLKMTKNNDYECLVCSRVIRQQRHSLE